MTFTQAAGRPPLAIELHTATRLEHATLNRTIMTRLPLCLPAATSTASLYTQGMTVFGQIYYGIEDAWDQLLSDETLDQKQKHILALLDIPQLRRRVRLDTSLCQLGAKSGHASAAHLSYLETSTRQFCEDVTRSILSKPHLLLAYTWTMYLALFNGGRWIANRLLSASCAFWRDKDRATTVGGALSFWFFGASEDYDGEDIKLKFKDHFATAAESLTDVERDEIIAESKRLFHICATLVAFLDENVQISNPKSELDIPSSTINDSTDPKSVASPDSQNGGSGLFASLAPLALTSWAGSKLWRTMFSRLPTTPITLPLPLRQEIEQKHG